MRSLPEVVIPLKESTEVYPIQSGVNRLWEILCLMALASFIASRRFAIRLQIAQVHSFSTQYQHEFSEQLTQSDSKDEVPKQMRLEIEL